MPYYVTIERKNNTELSFYWQIVTHNQLRVAESPDNKSLIYTHKFVNKNYLQMFSLNSTNEIFWFKEIFIERNYIIL